MSNNAATLNQHKQGENHMIDSNFKLHQFTQRGNSLLKQIKNTFANATNDTVKALAPRVPESVIPEDKKVTLVFAGQYSAGKSSIMKVLTGRKDIATGAAITTEKAQGYDWDGIHIIDTPGVHTAVRPDHDKITYEAISKADLLLFVITNELFDSHLAKHFHNLAVERGKAHEMMLVVNKMRRCAQGNSRQAQNIISDDLKKVLRPFTPEELRISFVDAQAALDSFEEKDKELAKMLYERSGIDEFIKTLNNFAQEKGLASQTTTALYTVEQLLQDAISSEPSGDIDIDSLQTLCVQQRRALVETEQNIRREMEDEIESISERIRQEGREASSMIHGEANVDEVNSSLKESQEKATRWAHDFNQRVPQIIGLHSESHNEQVKQINGSQLALQLQPRLVELMDKQKNTEMLPLLTDSSQKLGRFLTNASFNPGGAGLQGLFKLKSYSGTATHKMVLAFGDFFGKTFKPWEAVKWARIIGVTSHVFVLGGALVQCVASFIEEAKSEEKDVELRRARANVQQGFNEASQKFKEYYYTLLDDYIKSQLTPEITHLDQKLDELRTIQQNKTALTKDLNKHATDIRALINDVQTRQFS